LTGTGTGFLTASYASPEQLRGLPVTTLSDVYSLGVVLYELISEKAFGGDGVSRLESAQRLKLSQRLPGDLDRIVRKALDPEPSQRYSSVEQFSEDLRRYQAGEPVLAHPPALAYRAGKFVRRHAWAAGLAALFVTGMP